jgi:histidyl-tRNA synthetase
MLRNNNICVECIFTGKVKHKLDVANKLNCKYAIIIGEDEILKGEFVVKNLDLREEKRLKESDITAFFRSIEEECH